jgi:Family of unknown function (DUF5372)
MYALLTGTRFLPNQTQRDTPLFEELSGEVTVTDPTHPLYGQTLPCMSVRVHRSKTHVTVLLPTGRRRSVPRSATDLERPAEETSHDLPLPVISVRPILPLARFVLGLKQAKEERHAEQQAESIQATEPNSTRSDNDLAPTPTEQPAATGSSGCPTHSVHPRSQVRQGAQQ